MFWFIEKNSDAILEELDVTDVLDTLLAEGVISSNDYEGLKCWKDEVCTFVLKGFEFYSIEGYV